MLDIVLSVTDIKLKEFLLYRYTLEFHSAVVEGKCLTWLDLIKLSLKDNCLKLFFLFNFKLQIFKIFIKK